MTTSEPLTYDSDRLIREWRDRFTSRRSVPHQVLNEAEVLVREAIARERDLERAHAKEQREWELERRERAVEHAEKMQGWQIDRLQKQLAEANLKIANLSPRQTLMREERETVEDGTVIRLLAPKVPSYGDNTSVRPWMLGELEDVIYRIRLGGGDEQTEVRFKRDAIEACVPFAEFALAPSATPARPTALPNPVVTTDRGSRITAKGALLTVVIVTLWVVLLGMVIL